MPSPGEDNYGLPALDLLEASPPIDKESIEILCREKAYVSRADTERIPSRGTGGRDRNRPGHHCFRVEAVPGDQSQPDCLADNDMARALKAPAVRVVAPLPGKNTIGIEVPNIDKEKVHVRDVIETIRAPSRGACYSTVSRKRCLGSTTGQRPGPDAALADRGHDRLRQECVHLQHRLVNSDDAQPIGGPTHPDRSQGRRVGDCTRMYRT